LKLQGKVKFTKHPIKMFVGRVGTLVRLEKNMIMNNGEEIREIATVIFNDRGCPETVKGRKIDLEVVNDGV